jgi:hypothetical protein
MAAMMADKMVPNSADQMVESTERQLVDLWVEKTVPWLVDSTDLTKVVMTAVDLVDSKDPM